MGPAGQTDRRPGRAAARAHVRAPGQGRVPVAGGLREGSDRQPRRARAEQGPDPGSDRGVARGGPARRKRRPREGRQRHAGDRRHRALQPREQEDPRARHGPVHGRDTRDARPRAHARAPGPALRPAQAAEGSRRLEDRFVGCVHRSRRRRRNAHRAQVPRRAVGRRPRRLPAALAGVVGRGRRPRRHPTRHRDDLRRAVHLRSAGRVDPRELGRELGGRQRDHRPDADHAASISTRLP